MKKLFAVAAAALSACAFAEEGEGGPKPVSAKAGLQFDSLYQTYGVIDGKDPILTPSAKLTFFDWGYAGVSAIFDLTKGNGKRGGYGNRAGKYTTLDATVGIAHEFDIGNDLTFSFDFNYIYEFLRRHHSDMGDTQYLNLELGLGGTWIEPTLAIERDLMADNGTYVNLSLAHPFTLVAGKEEGDDPVLTLTPSIAQGLGNTQRTRGYGLAEDHGGLMDTSLKCELEWSVCEHLSVTAYVAYYDYWFDSKLRDGAREYNSAWSAADRFRDSYIFVGGLGITASF